MEEAGECPPSRAHGGCSWEAPGAPPVLITPRGTEEQGPGLHVAVEPQGQSLPACSMRAALVKHLQRGGDLQARAQRCFHRVRVQRVHVHPLAFLFLAEETSSSLQREPVPPWKGGEQGGHRCPTAPCVCGGMFLLFHPWVRHYGTRR